MQNFTNFRWKSGEKQLVKVDHFTPYFSTNAYVTTHLFFSLRKNTALDVIVVSTIVDKSNLQNLNLSFKIVASLKWRQWAKVQFMVWDSETPKTPRLPDSICIFGIHFCFHFLLPGHVLVGNETCILDFIILAFPINCLVWPSIQKW